MVKQMKLSFASLLGAVALMAGCTDDDLVKPIVRGEGVQFGASASFEAGNDNRGSRTEYGQVIGNKIQLNWVPNVDIIDIAYPEAAQSKLVAYDVLDVEHATDNTKSVANTLGVHAGQAGGLQWGTPGADGKHHFYAVYPSRKMFTENDRIVMDDEGFTGYMPNAQDPKEKTGNATQGYVLKPDMRYAYMVAKTEHADDAGAQVSLDFHPLVTALEFSITADHVVGENNIPDTGITLQGIQLSSVGGNEPNSVVSNICGSFNYKFKTDVVTDANPAGSTGFDQIYMNVPDGAVMKKGTKLDFTFFVIPTKNFAAKELKLTFVYLDTHGVLTNKTASIGRGIEMKKKYFFKNITFPAINADPSPSMWFSMLDNDILLDQLSIPVAGNAFTNDYTDTDTDAAYHKQQVTDYLTLWNQGVRGFELVTDWQTDFGAQHFVGGEKILTTSPTFDTAVKSLLAFMAGEKTKNECLFLICHYHPVSATMNPQSYITNLIAYFDGLIGQNVTSGTSTHTIAADDFVLLTEGMTTKDVRGKVCIIIRPGDDAYMKAAKKDNANCPASSDELKLSGTLGSKMLLIKNWGSAYDRWDKRYVGAVREATWADRVSGTTGTRIEEYIYGCVGTYADGYGFKDWTGISKRTIDDDMFAQGTKVGTSDGTTVYVQEWCRVVPQTLDWVAKTFHSDSNNSLLGAWSTDLQVKWPASIEDKKAQIDYLFKKSVKGNSMCVNVFSGYYITDKHTVSLIPFKEKFVYPGNKTVLGTIIEGTYKPSGQGNGGNFAGLAADLNTYVYKQLTSDAYGVGPLGLVQIDFIGATESDFNTYDKDNYNTDHAKAAVASQNLVSFIAMNNFRFPMKRGSGSVKAPGVSQSSFKADFGFQ